MTTAVITRRRESRESEPARRGRSKSARKPGNVLGLATHAVLVTWSLVTAVPILWVLMSSLKVDSEIFVDSWRPPMSLRWDNYARAWVEANFSQYFVNSLIVVGGALVTVMLLGSMISYCIARYTFSGRKAIQYMFIGAMAVPIFLGIRSLGS